MKKEFTLRLTIVCLIVILGFKFGVNPMLNGNTKSEEWAKGKITREQGEFDVIVLGEEPEGIAAAVASARAGAKTLLVSQNDDLGGVISKSLLLDLEPSIGSKGEMLGKGFFVELYNRLGKNFTVEKYIATMNSIIKKEKNLEVLYNASVDAPILEDNTIKGIALSVEGERRQLNGQMFIDATREGKVLASCGVPYFMGSEDLNVKNCFLPARFNFMVEGINATQITEVMKSASFYSDISKYKTSDIDIYFDDISILPQGKNRAIIKGLEVANLDLKDEKAVKKAYESAAREADFFTDFLKKDFKELEGIKLLKVAESFYTQESIHFIGEYVLDVSDILENKNFGNKVAIGSRAIDGSKFVRESKYIIGKPDRYAVPLGCLVPLKIDNLLMIGSKASYSSLAASSAGVMSVSIMGGQAAGIVSVYSLVKQVSPREIVKKNDEKMNDDIRELFVEYGLKMGDFDIKNENEEQWSYPYLKELIHLGLVAGGIDNDYGFKKDASQKDFVTLLLNGVYRLAPEKYGLEFDARLRKYFYEDRLTAEKACEILFSMYGKAYVSGSAYSDALKYGYVTKELQAKIKSKDVLKLEDVFYLSSFNIKKYTEKDILG